MIPTCRTLKTSQNEAALRDSTRKTNHSRFNIERSRLETEPNISEEDVGNGTTKHKLRIYDIQLQLQHPNKTNDNTKIISRTSVTRGQQTARNSSNEDPDKSVRIKRGQILSVHKQKYLDDNGTLDYLKMLSRRRGSQEFYQKDQMSSQDCFSSG